MRGTLQRCSVSRTRCRRAIFQRNERIRGTSKFAFQKVSCSKKGRKSDSLNFPHFLLSYSTLRQHDPTCRRSPASLRTTADSDPFSRFSLFASSDLAVQQPCNTGAIRISYSRRSQASLLTLSDPPHSFHLVTQLSI